MKRKLIVTLVASALELIAASAGAQTAGSCNVPAIVNGATPVRVGPTNPVDGFPEYVTDSNGISVQRCLDAAYCFYDPIVAGDPFSIQIGSGGEAFYWGASATVFNAAGKRIMTAVFAAESAFLQNGPSGEPIDGSQFPFLRLRFTIGVPVDGTYTVRHPYGTDMFTVVGATGARDVFSTVDRGLTSNSVAQGSVGPFLKWDPASAVAPAGFLGDGGAAGALRPVVGSPCGSATAPWNFVEITGVDNAGKAVDFGRNEPKLTTRLFSVQGKLYDTRVQTQLNPTRLTYSRLPSGAGQIDAFAGSTATAKVTVVDGPTIAVGTGRIATPVTLDRTAISASAGIDSTSVVVADPSAMPAIVTMTAEDATATVATDTTTLNLHLVDFVDIAAADFDPATGTLSVTATSGDRRAAPTLTLRDYGAFAAGASTKLVTTAAPPAMVHVDSASGGSATAMVRVMETSAPSAPSSLISTGATSLTLALTWNDTSNNENGFKVYKIESDGISRSLMATVGANVNTVLIAGLSAATSYTFQVDSFNSMGNASSGRLVATTLALPATPAGVTAATGTQRSINVAWTDNSSDETGFQILRATSLTGPWAQVATAAAGAGTGQRSVVDTSGPPATGTTYYYQITAVRNGDASVAATSAGLTTPTPPTSALIGTPVATSPTQVTVNWTDRSANESGYQVYRSTTSNGGFAPVSAVLAAGTVSFNDTTVTAGTQYFYRVDVSNWAATLQSGVSVGLTPQAAVVTTLLTPSGLTASASTTPVLTWADTSTGETGYRVRRTPYTVNSDGSVTAGSPVVLSATLAAQTGTGRAASYSDNTATRNLSYLYDVAALSGVSTGPVASVFDVATAGGLPGIGRVTLTRGIAGNAARVTVGWTTPTPSNSIGGYAIERCTGSGCTSFVKLTGTATKSAGTVDSRATQSFVDSTVARRTTYTYRMRALGGAGTGLTGSYSTVQTVTTQ